MLAGLTAAENVALPLELDGVPARKARPAGMSALEDLGMADRADRYADELSGGDRQRVAIARWRSPEDGGTACPRNGLRTDRSIGRADSQRVNVRLAIQNGYFAAQEALHGVQPSPGLTARRRGQSHGPRASGENAGRSWQLWILGLGEKP
jgi:hypothetical protein